MKVLSVTLDDYGAFYGTHTFRFIGRGLAMVLGDNRDEPRMNSNGAAKSTLFEALDWCLYGKVPKEDHADSIVNDEAKSCSVTTYLEDDDGTPATIKRLRPAALQFWKNGEEVTRLDVKETQRVVEDYLGMDRDVFKSTVFFGQNDLLHFADVGDAKRIEILTKIIPELGTVDEYLERAKAKRAEKQLALDQVKTHLARMEGQLRGLEGVTFGEKIGRWETDRQAKLAEHAARIQEYQKHLFDHQHVGAQLARLEAEAAQFAVPIPRPERHPDWIPTEERVQIATRESSAIQAEGMRLRTEIQKMLQTGAGVCSQCRQVVTAEHLQREIVSHRALLRAVEEKETTSKHFLDGVQAALAILRSDQINQDREWEAAEQARSHSLNGLNQHIAAFRQAQVQLVGVQQNLESIQKESQELLVASNPFIEESQKLDKQKAQLSLEIEGASEAVDAAEEALAYIEYWVTAFGPKGLKSYILDGKLQEMTDAANHWVKLLTGGTFWVRFETQKKGRSTKKLTNELNIRVFRYNPDGRVSERNYRSWSGGEKKRVSLAIDFGLSRLVARRARKRYDLLILDELFKHVDAAGGEAIGEMLEELKREKSNIFVIEHDPEFQTRFENRIIVRRQNARSTIVEVSRDGENGIHREGQAPSRVEAKPKRKAKRRRVSRRTSLQ
jgi:DNA repair exonuclease SbcCD ATPase subunit